MRFPMAMTPEQVSHLTEVSELHLRTWRELGLVLPTFGPDDEDDGQSIIAYSFGDVVLILLVADLVNHVEPIELLTLQPWLRAYDPKAWDQLGYRVAGNELRLGSLDNDIELKPLAEIVVRAEAKLAQMRERSRSEHIGVSRRPDVMGNAWVIAGTRVPTAMIWSFHEDGYDVNEIQGQYPFLTPTQIRAALDHERSLRSAA